MPDVASKIPPQNIEAEIMVLGALMIDENAIIKVADFLRAEDFYRGAHRVIFEAMLKLYEKQEPIDMLNVSNVLSEQKKLEEIGGANYLANLVGSVASSSNIASYGKLIQKKATLRRLIEAAAEISELGQSEDEDVEKVLDRAEQKLFAVSQKHNRQEFIPIKNILGEAFERIEKIHKDSHLLRGVPTGFRGLDNILGGLQRSDLIVLAARPSLGKTTLALDILRHVSVKEKIPAAMFSLEMSKDQLVDRLLAAQAEVDLWKLRTGKLEDEGEYNDFQRLGEAFGILSDAPIFIDDTGTANIMEMRTLARRLQMESGIKLIVVDYLQLMEGRRASEGRVQEIAEISRSLKGLARELNLPVIAISQLSRAVEARSPQIPKLSDLRESGSIEQDADVVLFIYREDREKRDSERQNVADIIVAKHRNGPLGKIPLYFNESTVRFTDLEENIEEPIG
ncbi:MAG: replicative DNA helicase [Candidatus Moranbacteria bacterium]|nr:replicative DNA helicase [Candidatus Moranbacteria bacterium]